MEAFLVSHIWRRLNHPLTTKQRLEDSVFSKYAIPERPPSSPQSPDLNSCSPEPEPKMPDTAMDTSSPGEAERDFFHPDQGSLTLSPASSSKRVDFQSDANDFLLEPAVEALLTSDQPLYKDEDGDIAHGFLEEVRPRRSRSFPSYAIVPWVPDLPPQHLRERTDLLALPLRELRALASA